MSEIKNYIPLILFLLLFMAFGVFGGKWVTGIVAGEYSALCIPK